MKFNDAITGLVLLLIALAVLFNIQSFPKIPGQNVGPAAFPGLLASLLLVCAVLLIVRGLRERAAHRSGTQGGDSGPANGGHWLVWADWLRSGPQQRGFLVTVVGLLFYIAASDWLGFIPTAIAVLVAMFWTLGVARSKILPIAIVVTVVIHAVFYKGLRVPLPWGLLMPIAW